MRNGYSYIVYIDGNMINAENGNTGNIDYRSICVTTVINNAIISLGTNGGKIILKEGIFVTMSSAPTIIMRPGIVLTGMGRSTIIKMGNNVNKDIITTDSTVLNHGMEVSNIYFDGNYDNNISGIGLHLYSTHFSRFKNLIFQHFAKDPIVTESGNNHDTWDNWFESIYIIDFKQNGFYAKQLVDSFMSNINIGTTITATGSCLKLECVADLQVTNFHTWGAPIGIEFASTANNTRFDNFFVESHTITGMKIAGAGGNQFTNGSVSNNGSDGISVESISNNFSNVISSSNGGSGYKIIKERTQIIGGSCSGNNKHGIYFYDPAYYSFHGSRVIGVELLRNSLGSANTYDGICLENAIRILIRDCYAWDYDLKQGYGINEVGSSGSNHIMGCRTMGNSTGGIHKLGADTYIRNCIVNDKPTENNVLSETFAIDSTGIKTITIPHGLCIAPNIQDCSLSSIKNTDSIDWTYNLLLVDNIDDTNVTVKINVSKASTVVGATARIALKAGIL